MRVVKIIAANIILLLVLLLLLEGALRIFHYPFNGEWSPSENALARFDKELGWAYLGNLAKLVEFEYYTRPVYTDANGIRVPKMGHVLSPNRPSVLFIGCSYTMGHGLSYEESFVGQFSALAEKDLQVVNLGVQAYGTDQALLALKKFAPLFNSKVVVYTFMEEHISRNNNYDRRMLIPNAQFIGTKPLFRLDGKGGVILAKRPQLYKDYLHSYLLDGLTIKLGERIGNSSTYPEQLTHALIKEIARYCAERKITFILLNWRWEEKEYNRFDQMGSEIIDTLRNAPAEWQSMRIPGDNHPDASAGNHIARLLRESLNKTVLSRDQR